MVDVIAMVYHQNAKEYANEEYQVKVGNLCIYGSLGKSVSNTLMTGNSELGMNLVPTTMLLVEIPHIVY